MGLAESTKRLAARFGLTEEAYEKALARNAYEQKKYAGGELLGNAAQQGITGWGAAQQAVDLQNAKAHMQMAQQQAAMNNAYAQQIRPVDFKTLGCFHLGNNADWTFDELNDEGSVYNMAVQTAIDLAINKFGSRWFKDDETATALEENKDFWLKVMSKLFKAGNLQKETWRDFDRDLVQTAWKILDIDHGNSR